MNPSEVKNPSEPEPTQYHNPSIESGSNISFDESLLQFAMLPATAALMNCGETHARCTTAQQIGASPLGRFPLHQAPATNIAPESRQEMQNVVTTPSRRGGEAIGHNERVSSAPPSPPIPRPGPSPGGKAAARDAVHSSMEDSLDRDLDLVAAAQDQDCEDNNAANAAALQEIEGILGPPPTLSFLSQQREATEAREISAGERVHLVPPVPVHAHVSTTEGNVSSPPINNVDKAPQSAIAAAEQPYHTASAVPLDLCAAANNECCSINDNDATAKAAVEGNGAVVPPLASSTTTLCTATELAQHRINRYLAERISEELLRTKSLAKSFKSISEQLCKSRTTDGQPIAPDSFRYPSRLEVVRQQSGLSESILSEAQVFASGTDTNVAPRARALGEALRDAETFECLQLEDLASRMARLRCQALEYRLVSVKVKLSSLVEEQTAKLSLSWQLSADETSRLRAFLREKQTAIMSAINVAHPSSSPVPEPGESAKQYAAKSEDRASVPLLPVPLFPPAPLQHETQRQTRSRRRHGRRRRRRRHSRSAQNKEDAPQSLANETSKHKQQEAQEVPAPITAKVEGRVTVRTSISDGDGSSSSKSSPVEQTVAQNKTSTKMRLPTLCQRLKKQWGDMQQRRKETLKLKRDHAKTWGPDAGVHRKLKRAIPTIDDDTRPTQTKEKRQKR